MKNREMKVSKSKPNKTSPKANKKGKQIESNHVRTKFFISIDHYSPLSITT